MFSAKVRNPFWLRIQMREHFAFTPENQLQMN